MKFNFKYFTVCLLLAGIIAGISCSEEKSPKIRVLILSGSNNHEWQKTTPLLYQIFLESNLFEVEITESPDTLSYDVFKRFDAVVSNWNSWPDNDLRWPAAAESGLMAYLREGGGLVFFHASSSALYSWPEFRKVTTGAWESNTTHGPRSTVLVRIVGDEHPVTKDLSDFYIYDELWINAGVNSHFRVLGTAEDSASVSKGFNRQPAIMAAEFDKGRVFHTILGHEPRTMRNTGFKTLIIRGTEWAASARVTYPVPDDLKLGAEETELRFSWLENDSAFALLKNDIPVWQYNFNGRYGKPFFHPVKVNRNRITCLAPDDHPWHLGQWFSWKYINGVNYWEYLSGQYISEGSVRITQLTFGKNPDYSATINLCAEYFPDGADPVLSEESTIGISPPMPGGTVIMDYNIQFTAVSDTVILDRTPVSDEPDGQSWGGYAGLSIRFNQDFTEPVILADKTGAKRNERAGNWYYMGFRGIDGKRVGTVIMLDDESRREGEAWYVIDDHELPFWYFSPAYLYFQLKVMKRGEKIKLKYRVMHFEGEYNAGKIDSTYRIYATKK